VLRAPHSQDGLKAVAGALEAGYTDYTQVALLGPSSHHDHASMAMSPTATPRERFCVWLVLLEHQELSSTATKHAASSVTNDAMQLDAH
jgi:hypothetical protein